MEPLGSLRYGDYGLRTTAGRALSFVCSTGLSRANIGKIALQTVDYERRGEEGNNTQRFSCFHHSSREIGEQSFGYTGFIFFAHEYLCQILRK